MVRETVKDLSSIFRTKTSIYKRRVSRWQYFALYSLESFERIVTIGFTAELNTNSLQVNCMCCHANKYITQHVPRENISSRLLLLIVSNTYLAAKVKISFPVLKTFSTSIHITLYSQKKSIHTLNDFISQSLYRHL